MSAAENRELLARYVAEVWDAADPDAVRRFAGPGYRRHTSAGPLDIDAQVQRLVALRAAFPDMTLTIDDVVVEGDRVAFRGTLRGTHRGEFLGVPATGRTVAVAIMDIIRVEGGLIVEHWGGPDLYDLTCQLDG
jgi:predicted ester cyclase